MARSRGIKPSIFKNEVLGVADPLYTLLFEGLWCLADREGRLEDRPLRIKAEVFPYRDGIDINAMLNWLQAQGFIRRYEVEGKKCILVCEFVKHQNPHKNEAPSELPAPLAEAVPNKSEQLPNKSEALGLTPDSCSLTPDSFNLTPEVAVAEISAPTPKARAAQQHPSAAAYVWEAYSTAYFNRYGVEPVRNAKVNAQLSQLVKRIGESEAPSVASFYVGHQASYYVGRMHPVDCLLSDAEKLRTEWATGRRMTGTKAIQTDKTATNAGAFQALIEAAEAKERSNGQH